MLSGFPLPLLHRTACNLESVMNRYVRLERSHMSETIDREFVTSAKKIREF